MGTDKKIIHLIGAGSIGSFTDFLLAVISRNLGFKLAIYDFDEVEPHNTINQLYWGNYFRKRKKKIFKVDLLKKLLRRFSSVAIYKRRQEVVGTTKLSGIVVVMVDSLKSRKEIFQAAKYNAGVYLYIDARSGGKHATIYAFDPRIADHVSLYEKTLEGQTATPPCADADTIPILFLIAGAVGQLIILYEEESPLRLNKTLISIDQLPIMNSSSH